MSYVDISGCDYLQVKDEFFIEKHICLLFSDEENRLECEECYNCHYKQLMEMKSDCDKLKKKVAKLRRVK